MLLFVSIQFVLGAAPVDTAKASLTISGSPAPKFSADKLKGQSILSGSGPKPQRGAIVLNFNAKSDEDDEGKKENEGEEGTKREPEEQEEVDVANEGDEDEDVCIHFYSLLFLTSLF